MKTLFQSRRLWRHAIFGQIQVPPLLPLSSSNGELFRVCVIGKSSCHHLLPIWFCRNRFVACSSVSHTTTAPPQNGGKGTQCYSTIGIDCNMLSLAMHNTCDTSIWRRSFFWSWWKILFSWKEKFIISLASGTYFQINSMFAMANMQMNYQQNYLFKYQFEQSGVGIVHSAFSSKYGLNS